MMQNDFQHFDLTSLKKIESILNPIDDAEKHIYLVDIDVGHEDDYTIYLDIDNPYLRQDNMVKANPVLIKR